MGDEVYHLIERAELEGRRMLEDQPRAQSASFDSAFRRITLELTNGCSVSFPVAKLEGLATAAAKDLEALEILGQGIGLHWESLDVDFSVPGLLAGVLGTKKWMDRQRAAHAGAVRSVKKATAARLNGAKGGRPRKRQA
jgi:hypothetical protein